VGRVITMNRSTIFTILLLTGCADFNPDLSDLDGSTGDGTSGETEGDSATSTSGPDTDDTGSETGTAGETDTDEGTGTDGSTDDTGGTSFCGDDMAEGAEECDGPDMPGVSCEDANFYGGGLVACAGDCTLDYSGCNELLYEQNFFAPNMPSEVAVGGDLPFNYTYGDTIIFPFEGDFWQGSCLNGGDDYCMLSGAISHSETSWFSITLDFAAPGVVEFWATGYTENADVLEFSIDNQVVETKGGNFLAWQLFSHPVNSAGQHQLKWTFRKDGSITDGFDAVWVDSITVTNAELP